MGSNLPTASRGQGQARPSLYLGCSVGRLTSLSPLPPPRPLSVHKGFNVFITCLTRCLIASPLNGAVTVETRNKRPPENEMIKQVTLAKQTQLRNLWGWGGGGQPLPHSEPEGLDQGCPHAQILERTGADTVGRPLLVSKILSQPSVGQAFWFAVALDPQAAGRRVRFRGKRKWRPWRRHLFGSGDTGSNSLSTSLRLRWGSPEAAWPGSPSLLK